MSVFGKGLNPFLLRPLDFGEILDQALRLYFRAWRQLLSLGAIAALPSIILNGVLQSQVNVVPEPPMSNWALWMLNAFNPRSGNWGMTVIGGLAVLLVNLLLNPLTNGAMIAVCARVYLNQPTTLQDGWRIAARRYWPLLGTGALFTLIAAVAAPALVIAGLLILAILTLPVGYAILFVYLVFRNHAIVVERAPGGTRPFTRSRRLVQGRFWPLLGLGLVFAVMVAVLSMIINYVVLLPLTFVQVFHSHSGFLGWVNAILSGAGTALIAPLTVAGLTVTYYDVRVRKEGFDLEMAAEAQRNGPVQS